MNSEESIYGFLANTKAMQITTNDTTALQKYVTNLVGSASLGDSPIINPTNLNRIILKIINTSKYEPIMAKAYYDQALRKIKIEVTYRTNAITKILDSKGNILSENSTTADTGDERIGNKVYNYIVIDNIGNQNKISVAVTGLNIYIIENENDLKFFRDEVNAGKTTTSTMAYQIADVAMNEGKYTINEETKEITFDNSAEQWTPIGNSTANSYKGIYYGDNHSINGIYINKTENYQGLFGYFDGNIQDLSIDNSYIKGSGYVGGLIACNQSRASTVTNCKNNANIYGSQYVGGIIGYSVIEGSKISNCENNGNILNGSDAAGIIGHGENGVEIEKCCNKGKIQGTNIGGIMGTCRYCKILQCYNIGDVNSTSGCAGGIAYSAYGYAKGISSIEYCYNTGNVTAGKNPGGILSDLRATTGYDGNARIYNCYNIGNVECLNSGSYTETGGIVGNVYTGSVYSCYNMGNVVTKGNYAGGIAGSVSYGYLNNTYNKGAVTAGSYAGGIAGGNSESNKYSSWIQYSDNYTENINASRKGGIIGYNSGSVRGCNYLKVSSNMNGIGNTRSGKNLNEGCTSSTNLEVRSIISVVGNYFVEDTENINNGYPLLAWQVENAE